LKRTHLQIVVFLISFLFANNSYSQLIVSNTNLTAFQLANEIVGNGTTFLNATLSVANHTSGIFYTGVTPTNLGMASGIILSSGSILNAPGPNLSGSISTWVGTGSDPQLAALIPGYTINDACYLQFDIVPQGDTIRLRYVFGSEEYPEWVVSSFNDVFGLFISGINPDSGTYSNKNIAIIPGTSLPVSIDNVNSGSYSQYFVNNTGGTTIQYDGFTTVLTAWCKVVPSTQYTVKFAVGDAGDNAYDSSIFIETGSLNCSYYPLLAHNNGSLCEGDTIKLTAQGGTPGCTYLWTGPNSFTSTQQNPVLPNASTAMAGDYFLQYIVGSYSSNPVSTTVFVNPIPTSTFTVSSDSVCANEATTLNYTGNATYNATYFWSVGGGTPSAITGPGPHVILWNDTGFVYPSLIVSENGCTSPQSNFSVYIKPTPIANAGNTQSISGGGTASLNGSATGGSGDYSYSWAPANLLQNASIPNPTTLALTNSTVFTFYVIDNTTGCVVSDDVQIFVIGGTLSVTATASPAAICEGVQTTLLALPSGGTGIYNYSWSSNPAGFTSSAQNPVVSPTVSTQYIVQITSDIDTTSASVTVIVNFSPAVPGLIAGPTSICKGSTNVSYAVPSVPNATGYIWIMPYGASIISGQNTDNILVNFSPNAISGEITVMATNDCGTGQAASITVDLYSVPVANAGINQTVNSGATVTLNGSANGGSGYFNYLWSPAYLFQNASLKNPTTIPLTSSATLTLIVIDNITGCSDSTNVQVLVIGGVLSVVASTDPASVCQGNPLTLHALPTGGTGNYTYSWTSYPVGFTSSEQNPIVITPIYSQYIVNLSDGTQTASASVTVNALPDAAGNITGSSTVNQGASGVAYEVPVINNATNYNWNLPLGVYIVSGSNTRSIVVNFTTGATSGVFSVYGSNSCGDGLVSQDFPVTVVTGIDEQSAFTVSLYPNPTNGSVTVEMNNNTNDNLTMKIYNIVGKLVFEKSLNNELRQTFQFDNFADGLYYVNFLGNKFNKIEKLIIQK